VTLFGKVVKRVLRSKLFGIKKNDIADSVVVLYPTSPFAVSGQIIEKNSSAFICL
jgi:hypothetical protein